MAKFVVDINIDNAAFEDEQGSYEVARILTDLAGDVEQYGMAEMHRLFDINGNRVGTATTVNGD